MQIPEKVEGITRDRDCGLMRRFTRARGCDGRGVGEHGIQLLRSNLVALTEPVSCRAESTVRLNAALPLLAGVISKGSKTPLRSIDPNSESLWVSEVHEQGR